MLQSINRNVLDLFSGIGGFSLGLTRAGFETIAFCEIDKYCQSILKKHWPDIPVFDDIKNLHAKDINATIDVICGGFPCQPFSVAGSRKGQDDDRFLWPEMFRLIQESHPRWVIGENVPGIINMALDQVLSDLESEGYKTQTFIIPACAINAPHRRDRVWIVADNESWIDRQHNSESNQRQKHESGKSACNENVSDSCGTGRKKRFTSSLTDNKGYFARTDFERITTTEWITEPGICSRNDGVSQRVARLKALGNSVVPYIPEIIGRMIIEYEKADK